tara:strand:+ start:1452 stop:1901 length:450 start_codon:yes stop_codon:yes gene_type:complete
MDLDKRISQKILEAIKAKDKVRLETLRAIKSSIILIKTKSSEKKNLTENEEINLLQKLAKQRRESAEVFKTQKRNDLVNIEESQLKIIEEFLPKQLDSFELKKILTDIVINVNAKSIKDMGKVMGRAHQIIAGRADGKKIAELVKKILS